MSKYLPFLFVAALTVSFSITIDADTNVYRVGSEIRVRLVLKNTSAAEIPYVRSPGIGVEPHGEHFTDVEVRDAKGELMPETRYLRTLRGRPEASGRPGAPKRSGGAPDISERPEPQSRYRSVASFMLKPGETREEEIVVTKLYDVSRPGRYSISASRRLWSASTDPNFE